MHSGDVIKLTVPPLAAIDAQAEEIPLDILFEDEDLLVVNKPAGLVVHGPSLIVRLNARNTLR